MRPSTSVRVLISVKTATFASITATAIWVLTPVPPPPRLALVGEDGTLLYSFYSNNNGSPLKTAIRSIQEIYQPAS